MMQVYIQKDDEILGRYLCEFIYYTSLYNCKNVLFIHVPGNVDVDKVTGMLQCIVHGLLCNRIIQEKGIVSRMFATYLKMKKHLFKRN
jgi:hypothetical protein